MQIRYDIFLTIGALFNDLYCATPNEVEAICIITELEDHRILFIGLQRGRSNRLVKFLCGELGAQMALECPEDIDSIDEALHRWFSRHQLEHHSAGRLDRQDAICCRHDRRPGANGDEA